MKEFNSLAAFATHLAEVAIVEVVALQHGLEKVAVGIENTAKNKIGHYQLESGPFPAWQELAESTKADRLNKGYDPDEPLLRDGTLRESIKHEVSGLEAIIGSKSDIAAYQEFGTEKIPPRPFIGPAAFENKEKIERVLGEAAVAGFVGGRLIPAALGYDFDVKS